MDEPPPEVLRLKQQIRREAEARRTALADREGPSRRIHQRLAGLDEYLHAGTVMCYVSFRAEVHTRPIIEGAWAAGKRVVVPYCVGRTLDLFRLTRFDELAESTFGLLEPHPQLRPDPGRRVEPADLDLIVVPGLAFDRQGGRLGHGKGYYDRLLASTRPDARRVAVAFECQLVDRVPQLEHDVPMDKVVTEQAVYVRPS